MPKTIPCWDCKGKGGWPIYVYEGNHKRSCETCNGGGVLSVYTEAELKKAVKEEREEIKRKLSMLKFDHAEDNTYLRGSNNGIDRSIEAIRARVNK